jgi:GNAT superfamily N-acetyltransferase
MSEGSANRMGIKISETKDIKIEEIVALYKVNGWSAAEKPTELYNALLNSHSLISAWDGNKLVGLGNAISDGHLVVYYPHLLVHPEYQREGIGRKIVDKMQEKYGDFHMQMLTADGKAINFYEQAGFVRAGKTQAMWKYQGNEH